MKSIGLETSFNKIGLISNHDKKKVTENINLQRLNNNPVSVSSNLIMKIISN